MDTLFSITTLFKRWYIEIQNKDVDKNYMISKLNYWIYVMENLKKEIMMEKSK